ncbi:MAG: hypothetical protein DRO18_00335 [Thermoprotei archaeon]|nr:MAG: hypothetical protein DRO18_00335 [Thermoprotei archaeon]
MKFIEFCLMSLDKPILGNLSKYNYKVAIVEGIKKLSRANDLILIPRITRTNIEDLKVAPKNMVKVLKVRSNDDIKDPIRLRRIAHAISLTSEALLRLGRKSVEKLYNFDIPVELPLKSLLDAMESQKYLKGLVNIIKAVLRKNLEIIFTACPSKPNEVIHPVMLISILEELGITGTYALKPLTLTPLRVLRSVGYVIHV